MQKPILIDIKYDLFQEHYRAMITINLPISKEADKQGRLHPYLVCLGTDLLGCELKKYWGSLPSYGNRRGYRHSTTILLEEDTAELERKVEEVVAKATAVIEQVQSENFRKACRLAQLPKDKTITLKVLPPAMIEDVETPYYETVPFDSAELWGLELS